MSRKKNAGISCLICVLCILCCVGLLFLRKDKNTQVMEEAVSYEQLSVRIDFPNGEQRVNIWWDEDAELFYFFLPTASEKYKITFDNLGEDSTLRLEERFYGRQDAVEGDLEFGKTYEMELTVEGNPQEIQKLIFMKSDNLPSLFIETASGGVENIHDSEEVKEEASIALLDADGVREYAGGIEYIKSRGNSSFYYFEKKPYQIKLFKECSLLGMPDAEKWILLANAIDATLIKNELVFRYAEEYTTVPTIRGEYLDLYMNGNYVGNYYLCEKVEVGENRLDITNLEKATKEVNAPKNYENSFEYISEGEIISATGGLNNPKDITGGYLVEHIGYQDTLPANCFRTDLGHFYEIVSPQNATIEQVEYIHTLFNEMEAAMRQEDGIHPITGKHFSEYIDVDSWTSKYVMEEVFHDPDASDLSMFFYKDSDRVDTHIYAGPMWDYDRAIGSYGSNNFSQDDPEQVRGCGIYVQEMMAHEEVRELVYEKFREYMIPYVEYLVSAEVHKLYEKIEASAEMNETRWPVIYGYYTDVEARKDYLIAFLQKKVDYLKDVWLDEENSCEVIFLDYEGDPYVSYTVDRGEALGIEPRIATWGGIFNGWFAVDTGIPFDAKLPIYYDVTYQAEWIEMDIILQNGLNAADIDATKVDANIFREFADVLEKHQQKLAEEAAAE